MSAVITLNVGGISLLSSPITLSTELSELLATDTSPPTGNYASDDYFTALVSQLPISEIPVVRTSFDPLNFYEDYYNRIHINPNEINLGNLSSRVDSKVRVWNAYRIAESLNSVITTATDGMQFSNIGTLPKAFAPFQEIELNHTATINGPPVIDGAYSFVFNSGEISLRVIGRRVLVFAFEPNWATPVKETIEWKTDVMTSYDGTEQRRQLRVVPRRGFEYDFTVVKADSTLFETLLWSWQSRNFALPVWTDKVKLSSNVTAGDTTIYLNTVGYDFNNDGIAIMRRTASEYEVVTIDQVYNDRLTLKYAVVDNWLAGEVIYPVVVGHLPTSVPTKRHTDNVITGSVIFATNPATTGANLPVAAPTDTYDGLEIILTQPNWRNAIDNTFSREFNTVDAEVGPVTYFDKHRTSRISRAYGYMLKSRDEIIKFRSLVQRLRGQTKTVWVPSWHTDMAVVSLIEATESEIKIKGTEFGNYIGVDTSRNRLMVELYSGQRYFKKILATRIDTNNTVLTIDGSFGIQIQPTDIRRIHYIMRSRLATDLIEIPWLTTNIAEPQLTFTTVQT